MNLTITLFNKTQHDRSQFNCGDDALNRYLKNHANQNQNDNISKVFVAVQNTIDWEGQLRQIYGYYTLSAGQISFEQLPETIKKKMPKYPVPVARIGRLAVDKKYHKQGMGGFLLHDALSRILSISESIGIFSVIVDAKENAKTFYEAYGFEPLKDDGSIYFMPIKTIQSFVKK